MTTFRYSWRRSVPNNDTSFAGTDGRLRFGGVVLLTSGSDKGLLAWDLNGLKFDGQDARGDMAG